MIHPFLFSEDFTPKRFLFADTPGGSGQRTSAERIDTNLPAPGSPEGQRLRLAALEEQLKQEEQRRSLESLKQGMELQREAQEQESSEVEYLLRMAEGDLEVASERNQFMNSVNERLSLMMAVLVADGEITEAQLAPNTIAQTFQTIEGRKGSLKVKSSSGERSLYTHEQNLLRFPQLLSNHRNEKVKEAWEQISKNMKQNVKLMRAASKLSEGSSASESFNAMFETPTRVVRKAWGEVVEKWNASSGSEKALMAGLAAIGGIALIWSVKKMLSSSTGRKVAVGILGGAALLLGGVWLHNRFQTPRQAWNNLKEKFQGLSQEDFMAGLLAYKNGDREEARRRWGRHASGLMSELGEAPERRLEGVDTPENREEVQYAATVDTLVKFYCFSNRDYPEGDKVQIKQAFDHLRNQPLSKMMSLWEGNKNNAAKEISRTNGILEFPDSIDAKNIYTATRIIAQTYEVYKKRFNVDETSMNLDIFLKKVATDPIHEASGKIQESLLQVISEGKINFSNLSLANLTAYFDAKKEQHTNSVCEKLGIRLDDLDQREKADFYMLSYSLYRTALLKQSTDEAFANITTGRSEKSIQKARQLFEKTKERTLASVLPKVIHKFNITNSSDPDNKDILKNYLTEDKLTFGQAFRLNVVSAGIEQATETSTLEELTLLFVALDCLRDHEKNRYYSELTYWFINAPAEINLPSLEKMRPYFSQLKDFAIEQLKKKMGIIDELLSAFTGERSEEKERIFRQKVRNADGAEFLALGLQEGARGGVMIAGDLYLTLLQMGATYEDCDADGAGTLEFILKMGGTLILPGEREGRGTGMIYLAGKYFFVKPFEIGWNSVLAGWEGQDGDTSLWGRASATVKTYVVGASPYVAIGAVGGLLSGGGWQGVVRGAARGLAAPVTAPVEAVRVGQRFLEAGRQLRTRGSLGNILRNADMVEHYHGRLPSQLQAGEWLNPRTAIREGGRRILTGNWVSSRYNTFLNNFRRSYNGFFGEELMTFKSGQMEIASQKVNEAATRLMKFSKKLSNHPNYASALDEASMRNLIKEIGILEDFESEKLLQQLSKRNGVEKLRNSIADAVRYVDSKPSMARSRAIFNAAAERARSLFGGGSEAFKLSEEAAEAARLQRAAAVAAELGDARPMVRAIGESLDVIKTGGILDEAAFANLKQLARTQETTADVAEALKRFGVAQENIDPLMDALKAEGSFDDFVRALQRAEMPTNSRLRTALDLLKRGGEWGLDTLAALKRALGNATNSQIYQRAVEGLRSMPGATAEKVSNIITAIKEERYLGRLMERLRSLGNFNFRRDALEAATSVDDVIWSGRSASWLDEAVESGRLGSWTDDVADAGRSGFLAESADEAARAARPAVEATESLRSIAHFDEALEALRTGNRINRYHLTALTEAAAQTDNFSETLKGAGIAADKADEVAALLKTEKDIAKLVSGLEKTGVLEVSRGLRGLAKMASFMKALPIVGALAGLGGSIFETRQALLMAEEYKGNPELQELMNDKAWFNAVGGGTSLVLDIGLIKAGTTLTAFGFEGALASTGIGLILVAGVEAIKYMVNGAMEANAETMKGYDLWAKEAMKQAVIESGVKLPKEGEGFDDQAAMKIQKEARHILIHHWFTTGSDLSVGEAYGSVMHLTDTGTEFYDTNREFTRDKLVKALISIESPRKTEDYKTYQYKFILSQRPDLIVWDFQDAEKLLVKSKLFADRMTNKAVPVMIGNPPVSTSLEDQRFHASTISVSDIEQIIAYEKRNIETDMKSLLGEEIFNRLESLRRKDPNYLNYASSVLAKYAKENFESIEKTRFEKLMKMSMQVEFYLKLNGYRFHQMDVLGDQEEVEEVLKIMEDQNLSKDEVIDNMGPYRQTSRGVAAFYTLASYFGYQGAPNIHSIRNYLTESKAERYGVYWDPSDQEWTVNIEYGVDRDADEWELLSHNTTDEEARFVISLLKKHKNSIFKSRYDAVMPVSGERDDEILRQNMAWNVATLMENAFEGTREKDIVKTRSDRLESPTAAMASSLAEDASSGFSTMAEAVTGNTTGLEMAGEQAVEEIKKLPGISHASNYIEAVSENGIDWDKTFSPTRWFD